MATASEKDRKSNRVWAKVRPLIKQMRQKHDRIVEPNDLEMDELNILADDTESCESLITANSSMTSIEIRTEENVCCTRKRVVTFNIVFLFLIVIIGIFAAIVISITKPNDSSSTHRNNQNSVLPLTEFPMSTIIPGNQSGSPCSPSTYTSINDPSRNYNYTGSHGTCDNGYPFATANGGAWIRFEGSGGTKIPTWPVDIKHCGAYIGIWSNTTLPTTINVVMNILICGVTANDKCLAQLVGSIIYCPGNYYVYFLPPSIICKARYCTA